MINTVHVGIGPLGQKVLRYAAERGCFNIVGAVDPDPEKAGPIWMTVRILTQRIFKKNTRIGITGS